jgi:hypothetical protein
MCASVSDLGYSSILIVLAEDAVNKAVQDFLKKNEAKLQKLNASSA